MSKEITVTVGDYTATSSGNGDYGLYSVYLFEKGKMIQHQSWGKKPTEEDLTELATRYDEMNKKPVVLRFVADGKPTYVASITFANGYFEKFYNTHIEPTDNKDYALRINNRELAKQLGEVAKKLFKIDVTLELFEK